MGQCRSVWQLTSGNWPCILLLSWNTSATTWMNTLQALMPGWGRASLGSSRNRSSSPQMLTGEAFAVPAATASYVWFSQRSCGLHKSWACEVKPSLRMHLGALMHGAHLPTPRISHNTLSTAATPSEQCQLTNTCIGHFFAEKDGGCGAKGCWLPR